MAKKAVRNRAQRSTKQQKTKSTKKSTDKSTATNVSGKKNSLVANINRRKQEGTSRSKKDSTILPESYRQMKEGWPKKKEQRAP